MPLVSGKESRKFFSERGWKVLKDFAIYEFKKFWGGRGLEVNGVNCAWCGFGNCHFCSSWYYRIIKLDRVGFILFLHFVEKLARLILTKLINRSVSLRSSKKDWTIFNERNENRKTLNFAEGMLWMGLLGEEEDISREQSCVRGSLIRWRYNPKDEHLERSWRGVEGRGGKDGFPCIGN